MREEQQLTAGLVKEGGRWKRGEYCTAVSLQLLHASHSTQRYKQVQIVVQNIVLHQQLNSALYLTLI